MEIEVLTTGEDQLPSDCDAHGGEYDKIPPLETMSEGLPYREEESHEDAKLQEPKAKPKRTARPKAVRLEASEPLGSAGSSSAPAGAKVKAKSRAKAACRASTGEEEAVSEKQPKEPEPVKEPEPALEAKPSGRGRPLGARNKPKPPTIVERVVEKTVYEKPSPLSAQDLQSLLKETLRKQELDAREQKRAYYSQLIRRNR